MVSCEGQKQQKQAFHTTAQRNGKFFRLVSVGACWFSKGKGVLHPSVSKGKALHNEQLTTGSFPRGFTDRQQGWIRVRC
jgi:hypothetical protein